MIEPAHVIVEPVIRREISRPQSVDLKSSNTGGCDNGGAEIEYCYIWSAVAMNPKIQLLIPSSAVPGASLCSSHLHPSHLLLLADM